MALFQSSMAKKPTKKVVRKKPIRRIGKKPSGGKLLYDAQIGLGLNKLTDVSRY